MKIYKYQFPARAAFDSEKDMAKYIHALEENLREGPEGIDEWFLFPKGTAIDHIDFDRNEEGSINAMNLYVDKKLFGGQENDLITCVDENLSLTYYGLDMHGLKGVTITEFVHLAEESEKADDEFAKAVDSIQNMDQNMMQGA